MADLSPCNPEKGAVVVPAENKKATEKVIPELLECCKALHDIYVIFGCHRLKGTPLKEARKMTERCGEVGWIKYMKYVTAAFFAHHKGQPLPEPPYEGYRGNPAYLLGGAYGRWSSNFLKYGEPKRREEFLSTILLSKKGMPRPGEKELTEAARKFFFDLTSPNTDTPDSFMMKTVGGEGSWADQTEEELKRLGAPWDEKMQTHRINRATRRLIRQKEEEEGPSFLLLTRETAESELRRTIRELFKGSSYTIEDRISSFFPSTKSNYVRTRSKGGQVGVLFEDPTLLKDLRTPGGPLRIQSEVKVSLDASEEERIQNWADGFKAESTEMDKRFSKLWFRILKKAKEEVSIATPHPLPESLKIRIITKGNPYNLFACKNLQRHMFKILNRHPLFQIGGEVTVEILEQRLGKTLAANEGFLSGDFKSATDLLKTWVLDTMLNELGKLWNFSPSEMEVFSAGLAHSMIEHPETGETKMQTRGQLMGHVLSFLFLCAVVATVLRWTEETVQRRQIPLDKVRGIVNGDDNVLKTTNQGLKIWREISAFFGLVESVGKTYYSREFLNINSRNYEIRPTGGELPIFKENEVVYQPEVRISAVRFVNLGLMYGLKRSGNRVDVEDLDDSRTSIGTRARELLKSTPEELQDAAMRTFLNSHKPLLSEFPTIPWFVPEWLGGFGIPPGPWGEASTLDLKIARRILLNWKKTRPILLGRQNVTWKLWDLATERLPPPMYTNQRGWWTEEYDNIAGKAVINLLFDSEKSIDDLKRTTGRSKVTVALRHNGKLWSPATGVASEPLERERLDFSPLYPNYRFQQGRQHGEVTTRPHDADLLD
jgi:hypothetical protein